MRITIDVPEGAQVSASQSSVSSDAPASAEAVNAGPPRLAANAVRSKQSSLAPDSPREAAGPSGSLVARIEASMKGSEKTLKDSEKTFSADAGEPAPKSGRSTRSVK